MVNLHQIFCSLSDRSLAFSSISLPQSHPIRQQLYAALFTYGKYQALEQDKEAQHKTGRDALVVRFCQSRSDYDIRNGLQRKHAEKCSDNITDPAGQ